MALIAWANSGATESTSILGIRFAGARGKVSVTTSEVSGEESILSIALPESTGCTQA